MKPSQTSDILNYMIEHEEGITQMQAVRMFGATRLSGIIFALKKRGWDIETIMESGKNRYGKTSRYGRYVLKNKG